MAPLYMGVVMLCSFYSSAPSTLVNTRRTRRLGNETVAFLSKIFVTSIYVTSEPHHNRILWT